MRVTTFLALLFCASSLFAQIDYPADFFIPNEVKRAYRNGTRSLDGKPGPNFWQNTADYRIQVEVMPEEFMLKGTASITYYNNSPDALSFVMVSLLHDIFKKGNIRDEPLNVDWINDGTQFTGIQANGKEIDPKDEDLIDTYGTNMWITLDEPLQAGEKLDLVLEWEEALTPGDEGRHGKVDENTSFVAYWYPKIQVYDDVDRWNDHDFQGQAEFYSGLSNMEVAITIPASYTVWATGVLQNAEEVLPDPILERFQAAATAENPITIIGEKDRKDGVSMKSNTWRFKADEVPDFAFAFSDRFLWEATSLKTENQRVRIHSVYPASRKQYCKDVTTWQKEIMKYFSEEMPGIPFPYPEFTSFYKPYPSGGMEFPMMANNGSPTQPSSMVGLTAHEMYHMYVPFYLRTNEEKYAWMDEGWANFMDARATVAVLGDEPSDAQRINEKFYIERTLGTGANVPLITSTQHQNYENYGYSAYTHPAFIYNLLEDALGEEKFKECLQGYMERWIHKSPTPYDFFFSFNDLAGEDLNWFFKPWFTEWGAPDLAIKSVMPGEIVIERKGIKPISIELTMVFADGGVLKNEIGVSVWKTGERIVTIPIGDNRIPKRVYLNAWLPDNDPSDNYYLAKEETAGLDMKQYAGTFGLGANTTSLATVTAGKQHIVMESAGTGNRYLLLPTGKDTFESPDGTFSWKFVRDGDGKITGYKSNRLGNDFEDTKRD